MKPSHPSRRQPLVEYFYRKDTFDLRGGNSPRPAASSFAKEWRKLKRETAFHFVGEVMLLLALGAVVVTSLFITAGELSAFFRTLAAL